MPSNAWNRVVYRLWAPVYDALLERLFRPGRSRAARTLALQPGERVLIPGVGTGLDLAHLPGGVRALGIDLSPAMLGRARRRLPGTAAVVELRVGDACRLEETGGSFDAAVLNLVLSVVPDPRRLLAEVARVLRPGGRLVIFDKFAPEDRPPSWLRRLANLPARVLGTELDRRLWELLAGFPGAVVSDEPGILRGLYRVVLVRRD